MEKKLKNKSTTSFAVLIIILVIIFHNNVYSETDSTFNEILIPYGSKLGVGGTLPVIKNFKFPAKDKTYHTVIAQGKKTRIEIEIIKPFSKEAITKYRKSKHIIIAALYGPQVIPYTGALTTTTECPEDKKPRKNIVEIMGQPVNVLIANATDRFVFGVWDDNLIKHVGAFAMIYDTDKETSYQITIFQPHKSFNQNEVLGMLKSFRF